MDGKSFVLGLGVGTVMGTLAGLCFVAASEAYNAEVELKKMKNADAEKENDEIDREIERIRKEVKADQEKFDNIKEEV